MLAYLRVVFSLKDGPALQRVINVPNRRMGKERISVLVKKAEAKNQTLWDSVQAMLTGAIRCEQPVKEGMTVFVRCVTSARAKFASKLVVVDLDLVLAICEKLTYDDYLRHKFNAA